MQAWQACFSCCRCPPPFPPPYILYVNYFSIYHIWYFLHPPQQADAAQDALWKGASHDLGDWIGEEAHGEEGDEDDPVELGGQRIENVLRLSLNHLVEESQLWFSINHKSAIGEANENDTEEEVEEKSHRIDVRHHLS